MSTRATLLRQYQRALVQWPSDVLRPDISFRKAIQASAEKRLGTANLPKTSQTLARESDSGAYAAAAELEKYPLSQRLLKPKSNPDYYEKLMKELEEAPKRSWLSRKINQWKGFLRFS